MTDLKTETRLEQINREIEKAVEENFGYYPNDDYHNALLQERDQLKKTEKSG